MRKLTYLIATTIDGFIADPSGSLESFLFEGDQVRWLVERYPDTIPAAFREALRLEGPPQEFDTVLMGRATYALGLDEGVTSPYTHLRQYVFSRSLGESPDPAVTVVAGDALAKVRELKAEPGEGIWLCGGGVLAHQVLPEIDELVVKVNPVIAGEGLPLFAGGFTPQQWRLTDSHVFTSGVAVLSYTRS